MDTTEVEKYPGLEVEDQIFENLKSAIRGQIIAQQDSAYEDERKVYNGMIDRYPSLIIKCCDVADVITSINFARDNNVLAAIRGGAHNAGGLGVCDGGIVIDLSLMKGIRVDLNANTIGCEGGCLLGDGFYT